jgi:hypothetical protein
MKYKYLIHCHLKAIIIFIILYVKNSKTVRDVLFDEMLKYLCDMIQGEEYKLFWPEQPEFVRMAARLGATIVPFGVVGEDDLAEVLFTFVT